MAKKKPKRTSRDEELCNRKEIRQDLLKLFADVEKGFEDQRQRSDDIMDYWDAYNCVLSPRQFYNGNSKIYIPIIRAAIRARCTRFVNQMFPRSGRYVDVTTSEVDLPHDLIAMMEHYVSRAKLKTEVMPALITNGDVEGQYTVYIDWSTVERHIVSRETTETPAHPTIEKIEETIERTIKDGRPSVEVIHDSDFLVLPVTVNRLEDALERGGSVTIVRRWSKEQIEKMVEEGQFDEAAADSILEEMAKRDDNSRPEAIRTLAEAAGIKKGQMGKYCLGYETYTKLTVDGDRRIVRAYYGGAEKILGCKLNPYWCDRPPVLSAPAERMAGIFKGVSKIQPGVLDMQVAANDAINEGMDSLAYALAPLICADPEKVAKWDTLVLDIAAVWPVHPDAVQIKQFPNLSESAFQVVSACKTEIFQQLSVNPAMIPQQGGRKTQKLSQAEIANEQQVDILTTSDAVGYLEEEILSPLSTWFAWLDHQFRDKELVVQQFGEMGMRATMQSIPVLQNGNRVKWLWRGVEAARNAAQIQQQIAFTNVLRGIPPQLYPGYVLDLSPLMVVMTESMFGPRLGPNILKDIRRELTVDAELENDMLRQGFEVAVHPLDNDQEHLQAHMQAMEGDASGMVKAHIIRHHISMQQKVQAAQQQMQQPGGQQGAPGGGRQPGMAGTPRQGAQPAGPRLMQGPPGMIRPDNMARAGAVGMPRRM